MRLIRSELGFFGELDDAFLVPLPGIPFAHGPSIPSLLPRGVSVFVIRAIARRAFTPLRGNRCQILRFWVGFVWCLCEFVLVAASAQERYACEVEGVDADFLLLMAGVVKSGVCSKARCGMGVGTRRTWCVPAEGSWRT